MNRWNIPGWLEKEVRTRDSHCVYCGTLFVADGKVRRSKPSWEHIINDARIVTRENIALCCISCNSSKGIKALGIWLQSRYCMKRGITQETVAEIVKQAISKGGVDQEHGPA